MVDRLKIALAQTNPTMGDIQGNLARLRAARAEAAAKGADLVVASEMVITGYPTEDLVLKPMFLEAAHAAIEALAGDTADGGPGMIVGGPSLKEPGARAPLFGKVLNSAYVLDKGEILTLRSKYDLPNYGVFDDKRVFGAGPLPGPVNYRGVRLGVMICEDMWTTEVSECLEESGAEILIVINGSPYELNKTEERIQLAVQRVTETGLPIVYVNQVGGQDELVFDGASFALNSDNSLPIHLPAFVEAVEVSDWQRENGGWICQNGLREAPDSSLDGSPDAGMEPIYRTLMLGLRDYVNKNRFPGVILGLSGGIDSALSAAIAVDALGPERVHCVMMPSPYTSRESLDDAAEAAGLMGIKLDRVSIEPAMQAFGEMLAPMLNGYASETNSADTTEENIQARSRGLTLMAISNKLGYMVLSTGNKSEVSVGYATLYGDMVGGYNVLKDVYKTLVFALSRWRNQVLPPDAMGPAGRVIPERIITKPPSAELKPDQKDEDSLPPYDVLDDILKALIEDEESIAAIVGRGHDRETVNRVWRMLELAEYKRRQACPGVKITRRAFGRDRRYPITNAFKGPA
ncbi:NAD+ synthase [Pelagibius sp.]|uniref:NAD+ synthase n=1 Tax=Pelagibius sp. TaxID=1931238 RepID=UPI00260EBAD9|nr:NAD+ synthase [Pelagibius sp.]